MGPYIAQSGRPHAIATAGDVFLRIRLPETRVLSSFGSVYISMSLHAMKFRFNALLKKESEKSYYVAKERLRASVLHRRKILGARPSARLLVPFGASLPVATVSTTLLHSRPSGSSCRRLRGKTADHNRTWSPRTARNAFLFRKDYCIPVCESKERRLT